jgi:hypothetical protein
LHELRGAELPFVPDYVRVDFVHVSDLLLARQVLKHKVEPHPREKALLVLWPVEQFLKHDGHFVLETFEGRTNVDLKLDKLTAPPNACVL